MKYKTKGMLYTGTSIRSFRLILDDHDDILLDIYSLYNCMIMKDAINLHDLMTHKAFKILVKPNE